MSGGMGGWRRERGEMVTGEERAVSRRIDGDADGRNESATIRSRPLYGLMVVHDVFEELQPFRPC